MDISQAGCGIRDTAIAHQVPVEAFATFPRKLPMHLPFAFESWISALSRGAFSASATYPANIKSQSTPQTLNLVLSENV